MGKGTSIEWADHTWNPWIGCSKVSPACDHCYAEALMDTRMKRVSWGGDRKRTSDHNWREPFKWNAEAAKAGRVDTVFCLSLGDIWDKEVPFAWRAQAFDVMNQTPNLVYLLLSKRIGNAIKMTDPQAGFTLPRNAALGSTVVNQVEFDRDAPKLKEAARVLHPRFTFMSIEPILGPIKIDEANAPGWIIVGGESGPYARPPHPQWVRDLYAQADAIGVPFLFKQWGDWREPLDGEEYDTTRGRAGNPPALIVRQAGFVSCTDMRPGDAVMIKVGKHRAGRLLDGVERLAFPLSLHVAAAAAYADRFGPAELKI